MFVDFNILNQLGSPAINSNTLANRPAAGQTGRLFVSIDTFALYRDNGTGWDLIGGPGTGTVTGSGAAGQVTYWTGSSTVSGNNNLFWDIVNERLGVGTTTPGHKVEINGTGELLCLHGGSDVYMLFHAQGADQYKVGYTDNSVDYRRWSIYDITGAKEVITIDKQSRYVGINYQYTSLADQPAYTLDISGSLRCTDYFLTDYSVNAKQVTTSGVPNGYSGFFANSATNSINWVNGTSGNAFWFIFPTGTSQLTIPNNSGTLALLSDIPSLSGYIQGSGTTNKVSKFTASGTIGDSLISDSGTIVKTTYSTNDLGLYLDFANNTYKLGDFNFSGLNGTFINVDDTTGIITNVGQGNFVGLKLDLTNRNFYLGDVDFLANGTLFYVDDPNQIIKTQNNQNDLGLFLDFANNNFYLGLFGTSPTQIVGFSYDNSTGIVYYGDVQGYLTQQYFSIDLNNETIKTVKNGSDKGLFLDFALNAYTFGGSTIQFNIAENSYSTGIYNGLIGQDDGFSCDFQNNICSFGNLASSYIQFNAPNSEVKLEMDGNDLNLSNFSTSATAGAIAGYLVLIINGTLRKIPYYAT